MLYFQEKATGIDIVMDSIQLFSVADGVFGYGSQIVFENLNFSLQSGVFYGLIGPNGSGKSTLIDLLMGTQILDNGTITFKSTPLKNYRRGDLAKHLALVPQHITVGFDFNVYDIVLMGRHPYIPRFSKPSSHDLNIVHEVLQLLDIGHLKNRQVTNLSGGEKQRVIVARALAQDTEVLMLDEATASLDIHHTIEIMRVLRQKVRNSSSTIIAAVHDLNLAAAFCDELLVLKDGKLYDMGPAKTILTTELLQDVFAVNGTISHTGDYPIIEYQMHPTGPSPRQ